MVTMDDVLHVMDGIGVSVDVKTLNPSAPLVQQGLDSLDLATLMLELEKKYGKPIPPEKIGGLRTIAQVVDYLNQ